MVKMKIDEAKEWFEGKRDMGNLIPHGLPDDGISTVRCEQANAAKLEQAYWVLRAHKEGLLD
jgi:hypothetical protein